MTTELKEKEPKTLEEFMNQTVDDEKYRGVYKFKIEEMRVKSSSEIFGDSALDDSLHVVLSDGVSKINLKMPDGIDYVEGGPLENGTFFIDDERKAEKSMAIGKAGFWKYISLYGYPRVGQEVDVRINEKGFEKLVL